MEIGSCEAEKWDITRDTCKFPHQSQEEEEEEEGAGKIWWKVSNYSEGKR